MSGRVYAKPEWLALRTARLLTKFNSHNVSHGISNAYKDSTVCRSRSLESGNEKMVQYAA